MSEKIVHETKLDGRVNERSLHIAHGESLKELLETGAEKLTQGCPI